MEHKYQEQIFSHLTPDYTKHRKTYLITITQTAYCLQWNKSVQTVKGISMSLYYIK